MLLKLRQQCPVIVCAWQMKTYLCFEMLHIADAAGTVVGFRSDAGEFVLALLSDHLSLCLVNIARETESSPPQLQQSARLRDHEQAFSERACCDLGRWIHRHIGGPQHVAFEIHPVDS